jgi:cytochrome c biogenesis protein CcdA/thiol-disulfide isomerase/thioredoxin
MLLLIAVAFVAGMVTVLSPCVLPILPVVLASATGGRRRPLALILGLVVSFAVFTLVISQLIRQLGLSGNVIRLAAVAIIGLLGLALIVPALNARLELLFSRLPALAPKSQGDAGWRGGLLTGATLGLVWAPCAGPILAAVTTLAATQRANPAVAAVALAYATGAGVPLLLIAYGGQAIITRVPAVSRHSLAIQKVFGGLMIVTALLIAFNLDVALSASAASLLPADWSDRLTSIETSPAVTAQLRALSPRPPASAAAPSATATVPVAQPASSVQPTAAATSPATPVRQPTAPATQPTAPAPTAQSPTPAAQPTTQAPAPTMQPPTPTAEPAKLAAQPAGPAPAPIPLPNMGPAPEFAGLGNWINSAPLALSKLRGKVVLVDFWTYSCINCIRTLPYLTAWYEKYKDLGFVIVGVHTPEFTFERDRANVAQAVKRYHITYPVAQDNLLQTWIAYNNLYWPAEYLIDADGNLRHTQFGEGNYDRTERDIQELLAEAGHQAESSIPAPAQVPISRDQTPESYIGLEKQSTFMSPLHPLADTEETYTIPVNLPLHTFAVSGRWVFGLEDASPSQAGDLLRLHFLAKDVYLVMTSDKPATIEVSVDRPEGNHSEDVNAEGQLTVTEPRLYHLVSLSAMEEATVTLRFDQPGVKLYAFTFGS